MTIKLYTEGCGELMEYTYIKNKYYIHLDLIHFNHDLPALSHNTYVHIYMH